MTKYKKYWSGYVAPDWKKYPLTDCGGKGWWLKYSRTAKSRHFSRGKEIVIYATSLERAQNVVDLIGSAIDLTQGEGTIGWYDGLVACPCEKKERSKLRLLERLDREGRSTIAMYHIGLACRVAAKASYHPSHQYALMKHGLSQHLCSVLRVDVDPAFAPEHLGVSRRVADHVRYACAIWLLYSSIEDIGLEIRASPEKPSKIGGRWNPEVKIDLENRLRKAGIKRSETILWIMRGKPTKIEKDRQPVTVQAASWAHGPYLRDAEMDIIEAISHASYLRSKIAAHKVSGLARSLRPYEVENVRGLARVLLLAKLGFWPISDHWRV